jgi:hypothetical protein
MCSPGGEHNQRSVDEVVKRNARVNPTIRNPKPK